MRSIGIVFSAAVGVLLWGAAGAWADVPGITDPYKIHEMTRVGAQDSSSSPAEEAPAQPPAEASGSEPAVEPPVEGPAPAVEDPVPAPEYAAAAPARRATPAPETVITMSQRSAESVTEGRPVGASTVSERAVDAVKKRMQGFGAFLGEAIAACQVGAASGAGGPALLVVAVLGLAAALTRYGALGSWAIADEDAREFLYAWDVIAPG